MTRLRERALSKSLRATGCACAGVVVAAGLVTGPAGSTSAAQGPASSAAGASAAYVLPDARRVVLGRSVRGREIVATRLGDPSSSRKALVVGAIHGTEAAGVRVTRTLRRRAVSGVDLWVVDSVNPDGVARGTRQNARGVDLNRNFSHRWQARGRRGDPTWGGPRPFSEPESRIVRRWVLRIRPAVTIWYHQPWGTVLRPCGAKAPVQRRYARVARMRLSCRGDGLPGTATSWERRSVRGATPFVVELRGGRMGAGVIQRNARAALAAVAAPLQVTRACSAVTAGASQGPRCGDARRLGAPARHADQPTDSHIGGRMIDALDSGP